eukprot:12532874-Alexandrium_andersonii.AAC.1
MSASLVGSEMCIRDRADQRPRRGGYASRAAARVHPPPDGNHQGAELGAVSYTHLTLPTICSV